ncbi:CST complex subunit STN1 [Actinomortierella ambigua]|nr:CST complex subunit STN1 [Actinomortierella ambigua]
MSAVALPVIALGLDPLFQECFKLFVFQVKSLSLVKRDEGAFYVHHGHPVWTVEVMGMVQSVTRSHTNILYIVDDGTGAVPCIQWIPHQHQMAMDLSTVGITMHRRGDVLRIRGTVGEFRGSRQIKTTQIDVIRDPDEESLFRLVVLDLEQSAYSKPFVVPEQLMDRLKDKEEHQGNPATGQSALVQVASTQPTIEDLKARLRTWMQIWSGSTKQHTFSYFDLASVQEHKQMALAVARSREGDAWPTNRRDQNNRVMHVLLDCIDEFLADRALVTKDGNKSMYEIQLGRSAGQAIAVDDEN